MHTKFWSENFEGGDQPEYIRIDGKIILEWILWKLSWKVWTGCAWLLHRSQWRVLVNLIINLRVP
jgi:hypothetical protein